MSECFGRLSLIKNSTKEEHRRLSNRLPDFLFLFCSPLRAEDASILRLFRASGARQSALAGAPDQGFLARWSSVRLHHRLGAMPGVGADHFPRQICEVLGSIVLKSLTDVGLAA